MTFYFKKYIGRAVVFAFFLALFVQSFNLWAQYLTMTELRKYQDYFKQMDKSIENKDFAKFSSYFLENAIFVYTWRNADYRKFQSNQNLQDFLLATEENLSTYDKITIDREFISAKDNGDSIFAITYATYAYHYGGKQEWVRFREHYELKSGEQNSNDFKVMSVNSYYEKGLTSSWNFPVHWGFRYYER